MSRLIMAATNSFFSNPTPTFTHTRRKINILATYLRKFHAKSRSVWLNWNLKLHVQTIRVINVNISLVFVNNEKVFRFNHDLHRVASSECTNNCYLKLVSQKKHRRLRRYSETTIVHTRSVLYHHGIFVCVHIYSYARVYAGWVR